MGPSNEAQETAHKWLNWSKSFMNRTQTKQIDIRNQAQEAGAMDDLVKRISELAKDAQKLAREAVQQYSAEVEAILKAQSRDSRRIERCLDAMLDFCFDDGMLVLYKKLCRYYFDIDPRAAVSYVHAYREMWDKTKARRRPTGRSKRQTWG